MTTYMIKKVYRDAEAEAFAALLSWKRARAKELGDKREAERRVRSFLEHEDNRHKKSTPDLGKLLVSLTLSAPGWPEMCYPFLKEMLAPDTPMPYEGGQAQSSFTSKTRDRDRERTRAP